MIDATGDSMYPTISPGDHIVIEAVEDPKTIQLGRAYVVVAKEGCVIKRVHSNESPKKFTLKSDNTMYEPYEINKDDVISIWLVRNYLVRTNLAPRSTGN
jgi:phage repressor protein C with HTH and peptisase S24 domain